MNTTEKIQQYIQDNNLDITKPKALQKQLREQGFSDVEIDTAVAAASPTKQAELAVPAVSMSSKKHRIWLWLVPVLALLGIGGFLLSSNQSEERDPEEVFSQFLDTNLSSNTFTQTFKTVDEEFGLTVTAESKTDFSDPTNQKSDIDIVINVEDDQGDLNIDAKIIAIGDDVYINYNDISIGSDDPLIQNELESGDDFLSQFGLPPTGTWQKLDSNPESFFDSNDVFQMRPLAESINTVIGEMPIGNFGDKSDTIKAAILDSYTISYDEAIEEMVNGRNTLRYSVGIDSQKSIDVSRQIIQELGLSDWEAELVDEIESAGYYVDSATIWVDLRTSNPVRVETQDVTIDYTDFGQSLDITPPVIE